MGILQSFLSVGTEAEETKPAGLNDVATAAKGKRNDNQQIVRQQPSRKAKTTLIPLNKTTTTTTKMQLRSKSSSPPNQTAASKKRKIATLTKKANQQPKKRQKKAKAPTRKEDSGKKKEAAATNASESSMSEPHEQEQEDAEDEDPVPQDHKRCPLCNKVFHNKGISRHLVWCQEQQQQEQAAAQSEEDDAAAGNVDSGHSAATNNNIAASNAGVTTGSKSKSIAGGDGGDDDDDDDDDGDGDADDHSNGNGGGRGGGGKKDDKDEDDDDDEDEEGSENEDDESENEDDERSKKLALLKCFAEGLAENAKARKSGTASASMIQAKEWFNKLPGPVVEKITAMTNAILINAAASRRTNTNDSKARKKRKKSLVESWGSISSITSILPKKSKCRGLPNTNRHKREIDRKAKSGLLKRIKKIDKMGNVISIDIDDNDSWNPKPWEEASFSQASDPPIWSFVKDVIYEISQMKEDGYDNNDDRPWLCGYYHLLEGGYDNRPWLRCYHLENNGVGDAICKTLMVLPSNDNNETVSDSVNFFLKLGWYTNHYGLMKPLYTFVDVDNKICTVSFPIDDDVKAKDIVLDLDKNNLRIGIKTGNDDDDNGVLFFIKDEVLWKCVLEDDSSYEIGDIGGQRSIVLELSKKDVGPWEYLLQSDAVKSCMGRLVDKVCKRAEDDATKSTATDNNTLDNNSLADSEDTESDSDDTAEVLRYLVAARQRWQKQDIAYKDDEGEDNTTIVDAAPAPTAAAAIDTGGEDHRGVENDEEEGVDDINDDDVSQRKRLSRKRKREEGVVVTEIPAKRRKIVKDEKEAAEQMLLMAKGEKMGVSLLLTAAVATNETPAAKMADETKKRNDPPAQAPAVGLAGKKKEKEERQRLEKEQEKRQEEQVAKTKAATAAAQKIKKDGDDAKRKADAALQKKQQEDKEAVDAAAKVAAAVAAKAKKKEAAAKEPTKQQQEEAAADMALPPQPPQPQQQQIQTRSVIKKKNHDDGSNTAQRKRPHVNCEDESGEYPCADDGLTTNDSEKEEDGDSDFSPVTSIDSKNGNDNDDDDDADSSINQSNNRSSKITSSYNDKNGSDGNVTDSAKVYNQSSESQTLEPEDKDKKSSKGTSATKEGTEQRKKRPPPNDRDYFDPIVVWLKIQKKNKEDRPALAFFLRSEQSGNVLTQGDQMQFNRKMKKYLSGGMDYLKPPPAIAAAGAGALVEATNAIDAISTLHDEIRKERNSYIELMEKSIATDDPELKGLYTKEADEVKKYMEGLEKDLQVCRKGTKE